MKQSLSMYQTSMSVKFSTQLICFSSDVAIWMQITACSQSALGDVRKTVGVIYSLFFFLPK